MRRAAVLLAMAFGAATLPLAAWAQGPNEILCRDPGVHGGALLVCGGREIHLFGITAPAPGQAGFEPSVAALENLVRFRDVRCRVRRNLTLNSDAATCYVGARDLAAAQVREGHAVRTARN